MLLPLATEAPDCAWPPIGDDDAPLQTSTEIPVEFVHVPDVSVVPAATAEAQTAEQAFAPVGPLTVVKLGTVPPAAGTVGGVVLPSRYAQMMIRSPATWAGIAIEVAAADEPPTRLRATVL
jgi:hypothetical protein